MKLALQTAGVSILTLFVATTVLDLAFVLAGVDTEPGSDGAKVVALVVWFAAGIASWRWYTRRHRTENIS